jgi:hypothetical protein
MTYPLIGNYGVSEHDIESRGIFARGFVCREIASAHSNYRADLSLGDYLAKYKVTGITGIDTRALTRKLRITGAMSGVLSTEEKSDSELVDMAKASRGLAGINLPAQVSQGKTLTWDESLGGWAPIQGSVASPATGAWKQRLSEERGGIDHLGFLDGGCPGAPDDTGAGMPPEIAVGDGSPRRALAGAGTWPARSARRRGPRQERAVPRAHPVGDLGELSGMHPVAALVWRVIAARRS